MNVTLIRHAESEYNLLGLFAGQRDIPFSENGIIQAKNLSKNISQIFEIYYCSPLIRARQTAVALFGKQKYIFDERIKERNFGEWQGKKKEDFSSELIAKMRLGEYDPPDAETYSEFKTRIKEFVEDLRVKHNKDSNIAVISHNGVIRLLSKEFGKIENYTKIPMPIENLDLIRLSI